MIPHLSPGQQSSHILRRTISTMKDRIYSSDTEKWVFTYLTLYPPFLSPCQHCLLPFCAVIWNLIYPVHYAASQRGNRCAWCMCVHWKKLLCPNRKRGSWSLRAYWISSGACGDQSGFRCKMTTSVSVHHPLLHPGTRVAIWTVKGKWSRWIQFQLAEWKW